MTQITPEQQQQLEKATRVAAKLREFHDGLPAEEQMALHLLLGHGAAANAGPDGDVAGYAYTGATVTGLSFAGFTSDGPINPDLDWCGTCRNPWNPSKLPR
ncbi:MAG: hypothetical protein ACRDJE_24785 [Dehalococcoidia bacterium]